MGCIDSVVAKCNLYYILFFKIKINCQKFSIHIFFKIKHLRSLIIFRLVMGCIDSVVAKCRLIKLFKI